MFIPIDFCTDNNNAWDRSVAVSVNMKTGEYITIQTLLFKIKQSKNRNDNPDDFCIKQIYYTMSQYSSLLSTNSFCVAISNCFSSLFIPRSTSSFQSPNRTSFLLLFVRFLVGFRIVSFTAVRCGFSCAM